jgi:orotidine-5'-phosphate decarboxylase
MAGVFVPSGEVNLPLPKERIIVALDVPSFDLARPLIKGLHGRVGFFKIGWTLLVAEGLNVLERIDQIAAPTRLFLDLKFSGKMGAALDAIEDIPLQIQGVSALLAAPKRVEFLTVHTHEGEKAVSNAVRRFKPSGAEILGVTVLTSARAGRETVLKMAGVAKKGGCDGVVCSGREAKAVKAKYGPDFLVVTPGIRPSWSRIEKDDQRRTMTPAEAIRNGADYLVVGRPIYREKDFVGAAIRIADEIEAALAG